MKKNVPAAIVCLALSLALAAPSSAQKKHKKPAAPPPAAAVASPLDPTLADLDRVSAATLNDLADLKAEKRRAGWKTGWMSSWRFWRHDSSHSQTLEFAESVERNIHDALPGMVQDTRSSGSFSATFKLYNDLSVLCELLDSLVDSTKADGKKDGPLANDSAALGRIRQDLATFVIQKAAALDANGNPPYPWPSTSVAANKVKKIVIDDNAPERKPVARKTVAAQQ